MLEYRRDNKVDYDFYWQLAALPPAMQSGVFN